jgi:hypothetical protein
MAYAILRVTKLKTGGNIGGSLAHTFRTKETPNADPAKMDLNSFSHSAPPDLAAAIQERMPEKFRKDAVRCLEYFVGASPEWFSGRQDGERYFRDAMDFLKKQHGEENLAGWAIHRDEKSPHLVAYFVPLDEGKLNAKRWTGGREKLSKMQTAFAQEVGQKHGLKRGIEGSKAKHQEVQRFYGAISQEMKFTGPRVPKIKSAPSGIQRFSPPALQEHIDHLAAALATWEKRGAALVDVLDKLAARAKLFELAQKEAAQAKRTAEKIQESAKIFWQQGLEGQKKGKAAEKLEKALQEARQEVKSLKGELGTMKAELSKQEGRMRQLTVGDVALALGDEWARKNIGEVAPGRRLEVARQIAPEEWQELAREKVKDSKPTPKKGPSCSPSGG